VSDEDYIDTDALLRLAFEQASRPRPDGGSAWMDFVGSVNSMVWIHVLAAPPLYRSMGRRPTPEHLVNMVDLYLAYVRRGGRSTTPKFDPVPYEQREPSALRLRALLEAWTPPDLTEEITTAARQVLYAEGDRLPDAWDQVDVDPEYPVEPQLWWPEDVPEPLRTPPPPESRA
jgi:hypothetical protein